MHGNWYEKVLSANDAGLTGSHQSAVVIPKVDFFESGFFPELDLDTDNPEVYLSMQRRDGGPVVTARFVYYNNKRVGGTRDEVRLTGLSEFIKSTKPNAGDILRLEKSVDGNYFIAIRRALNVNAKKVVHVYQD